MKGIMIKKENVGEFVKTHKKEIITGAIAIAVIGGLVYISYKSGFKAGVKANTFKIGGCTHVDGYLPEDGSTYALGFTGPTYGCGLKTFGVEWSRADAADIAVGILNDLGYLKKIVEVPGKVAEEVVANG